MKIKTVKRYYCDFCKKANCSATSIKNHESGCSNNPNRVCRMCKAMGNEQPDLKKVIDVIPTDVRGKDDFDFMHETEKFAPKPILAELIDKAQGCPVCAFSAMRQSDSAIFFMEVFKLKEAVSAEWQRINDNKPPDWY